MYIIVAFKKKFEKEFEKENNNKSLGCKINFYQTNSVMPPARFPYSQKIHRRTFFRRLVD